MKFVAAITRKEIGEMGMNAYTTLYCLDANNESEAAKKLYKSYSHIGKLERTIFGNGVYIEPYSEYEITISAINEIETIV